LALAHCNLAAWGRWVGKTFLESVSLEEASVLIG